MLKAFKRTIRSKDRDDETDARRFEKLLSVLADVNAETSREYEGLVKRMRELSSREINETVYSLKCLSATQVATSQHDVTKQLQYAVKRTKKLVEQVTIQKALIEDLRKAREDGIL